MSKRLRFLIIISLFAFGVVMIYPTIRWYFFIPEEMKMLAQSSRIEVRSWARNKAQTILDELQVLATANEPLPEKDADVITVLLNDAEAYRKDVGTAIPETWTTSDVLSSFRDKAEVFETLETYYRTEVLALKDLKTRIVQLGLDLSGGIRITLEADENSLAERLGEAPSSDDMSDAVDLATEIIRNRIDRFGVTEPQFRLLSNNRIEIEIPGDNDKERVNSFLLGKGSLNFHLVDDNATDTLIALQRVEPSWDPSEDENPGLIPFGSRASEYVTRDQYGIDKRVRWIVIHSDIAEYGLSGEHITEAEVGYDSLTNQPVVNFVLDGEGADEFSALTRDNINSSLAIVMDDKVRAYARIQEEIPTGQVRITGFNEEEASAIALVLRTAALPVDLNVINQQVVGAALGNEAIQLGLRSVMLGFILVVVFMLIYYKGSGVLANIALLLNLFFIIAVLSAFNLTLTLTSIAGIILTVGMAVDANVIIFERIKEEYRLGKGAKASVDAGFKKAFWTVMDANITTFIAALFLSQLGSGPIQGFAVTLAVGIISSMFTALFVTRLLFDFGADVLQRNKLSIVWGKI